MGDHMHTNRAGLFVSREPRTPRVTCAYTPKFLTQPDLFHPHVSTKETHQ